MSRFRQMAHRPRVTIAAAAVVLLGMFGLAAFGPPSLFAANGVDDLLAVDLDTTDNPDPRTIGNVAAFAELTVGETRSVDIVVQDVDNLVGFIFRIDFPPYVQVNSVESVGSFVLAGLGLLPPDGEFNNLQTPDSDGFDVQVLALTGDTGANTTGTLFRFEIEAISTGSGGSIDIGFVPGESELLLATSGTFVPAVVQSGVVNVAASSGGGGGGGGGGGTVPPPPDSDEDGLTDPAEAEAGTDPNDPDTDGDTLLDGAEVNDHGTDPLAPDSDNDGLPDGEEVLAAGTDALTPDSDGDGLLDGEEALALGTDPLTADTDGDGVDDGAEVMQGSDPLDAGDGGEAPPTDPPPMESSVASQTLDGGFNPLTYTGSASVPVEELAAMFGTRFIGVWRYEAKTQSFVSYRVDAPAFVNALETINPRDALLVLLSPGGTVTFETPALTPAPRSITVVAGWNQIAYTGPDGTPIADLLGSLVVQSAWLFDQPTESWLAYFPGQAAFLQQFEVVDGNGLLFFRATAAGTLSFEEGIPAAS